MGRWSMDAPSRSTSPALAKNAAVAVAANVVNTAVAVAVDATVINCRFLFTSGPGFPGPFLLCRKRYRSSRRQEALIDTPRGTKKKLEPPDLGCYASPTCGLPLLATQVHGRGASGMGANRPSQFTSRRRLPTDTSARIAPSRKTGNRRFSFSQSRGLHLWRRDTKPRCFAASKPRPSDRLHSWARADRWR